MSNNIRRDEFDRWVCGLPAIKADNIRIGTTVTGIVGTVTTQNEWIRPFDIKNVVFNDPLTIVIWADGTKTFVKRNEKDNYDPEKALAMAIAKKALGNKYKSTQVISDWVEKKAVAAPAEPDSCIFKVISDWVEKKTVAAPAEAAAFMYVIGGLLCTFIVHDFGYLVGFLAGIISASILYVTRRD